MRRLKQLGFKDKVTLAVLMLDGKQVKSSFLLVEGDLTKDMQAGILHAAKELKTVSP